MTGIVATGITDEKAVAEALAADGYGSIYVWTDGAGSSFDWHIHLHQEVRWIVSGGMTIGTETETYHLSPGDRLDVPKNVRHWAKTEKGVRYICGTKRG